MPYEIAYLDEHGGVITTYWGTITDSDITKSGQDKYSSLDRLRSYRYVLTDLSRVEEFNLTSKGIQSNVEISSLIYKENNHLIVAFVLPTNVEYGMGRMWQAYAEQYGIKSHISRTRADAEAWIRDNLRSASIPENKIQNKIPF